MEERWLVNVSVAATVTVGEEEVVALFKGDGEVEVEGVILAVAIRLLLILKDGSALIDGKVDGEGQVDGVDIEDKLPNALVLLPGVPINDAVPFNVSVSKDDSVTKIEAEVDDVIESVADILKLALSEKDNNGLRVGRGAEAEVLGESEVV